MQANSASFRASFYCAEGGPSTRPSEACYGGPENIEVMAVVIAELGLSDIQGQVLGRNLVVTANDGALKQAPLKLFQCPT
jgi:hypothetical protein